MKRTLSFLGLRKKSIIIVLCIVSGIIGMIIPYNHHLDDTKANSISSYDAMHLDTSGSVYVISNDTQLSSFVNITGNGTILNPYIIENMTIDAQGNGSCIEFHNIEKVLIIQKCNFTNSSGLDAYGNFHAALLMSNCSNITIQFCNFNTNLVSSSINNSENIRFKSNNIINGQNYGLSLKTSRNITVTSNTIIKGGLFGIRMLQTNESLVKNNSVFNSTDSAIKLENSHLNILEDNEICFSVNHGIVGSTSTNNTFLNNSIGYNAQNGIFLNSYSHYNNLTKNNLTRNKIGITLSFSIMSNLSYNNITLNSASGIIITTFANQNTINNNSVCFNGEYGLRILLSTDNNVYNNSLLYNRLDAIDLSSTDNTILYNDFSPPIFFIANDSFIIQNETVQFNYSSQWVNNPLTYEWDFGDGTANSTEQNPSHQYLTVGNFTVHLVANDTDGDVSFCEMNIVVEGLLTPVASFEVNASTITVGQSIQCTDTTTSGNLPLSYQWNFGDGPLNSTQKNPVHKYTSQGTFWVVLAVSDGDGDISIAYKPIDVQPNQYPIANFSSNTTVIYEQQHVQFFYTGDEGDGLTNYQWNFGDGSTNSTEPNPAHQYMNSGNYTVNLTVTDINGDKSSVSRVDYIDVIEDLIPVANFTANVTTIFSGESIQFNYTGSEGNGIASYQWNFNDGSGNATSRNPAHVFNLEGNYSVILTVNDSNGDSTTEIKQNFIIVEFDTTPTINFTANSTQIVAGDWVQFMFYASGGNRPFIFDWDFGDESLNSTDEHPAHQFNNSGTYNISLIVIDRDGDVNLLTKTTYILVEPELTPYSTFSSNITSGVGNLWVQFNFTGNPGNLPTIFDWNFGDGTLNSSDENPIHHYTLPGNYTVTITIIDKDGDTSSTQSADYIQIENILPQPDFSIDKEWLIAGEMVNFTFTGILGDAPATLQWNFGDMSSNSTELNPSHVYQNPGNYTVTLTVNDGNGDVVTIVRPNLIFVEIDLTPLASFYSNANTIRVGDSVQFYFNGALGNLPATIVWNFGDNTSISTAQNPIHVYSKPGTYTVQLTVIDLNGDNDTLILEQYIVVEEAQGFLEIIGDFFAENWWILVLVGGGLAILGFTFFRNRRGKTKRGKRHS